MSTNWGSVIRRHRIDRGMTQLELATKVGIKRSILSHYELGRTKKIDSDLLARFARAFEVSTEQLAQEIYGKPSTASPNSTGSLPLGTGITTDMVHIPIVGRVPCGKLDIREETNLGYLAMPRQDMRGIQIDGTYALIADGESLAGDDIHDGYCLLCNTNLTEIVNGKIYIVRYDGQVVAKHVITEPGCVILRSSNPDFKDVVLPVEDQLPVEIIGRVVRGIHQVYL